jgi:hypothetical protein
MRKRDQELMESMNVPRNTNIHHHRKGIDNIAREKEGLVPTSYYAENKTIPGIIFSGANDFLQAAEKKGKIHRIKSLEKNEIVEFERQDGVVIVTKVHGTHQMTLLEQSLCLLHYAYNNRVLYDILVFTTTPINETDLVTTRRLVAPAKLTVVVDNQGLQNEIQALTPIRREKFLERCNETSPGNLTWWSNCPHRLAYTWQSEFRAWHIWRHPALSEYKYMMWLDTDGFSSKVWDRDPVAYMIQEDLVLLFDNFPAGRSKGRHIQERVFKAFNTTLCRVGLKDGHLHRKISNDCFDSAIPQVHGFFHITNLEFYRSDPVMYWAETLIGDCYMCREYDDQVGVTVPAAILAPERSRDMRSNGIHLDVYHNSCLDGKDKECVGGFLKYWKDVVRHNFTEPVDVCPIKCGN